MFLPVSMKTISNSLPCLVCLLLLYSNLFQKKIIFNLMDKMGVLYKYARRFMIMLVPNPVSASSKKSLPYTLNQLSYFSSTFLPTILPIFPYSLLPPLTTIHPPVSSFCLFPTPWFQGHYMVVQFSFISPNSNCSGKS